MSGAIKAIDTDSVHRIHSGQVVLDLQGAIKELVENSLDAGATIVDVRIKDHGLESVEVIDNGSGIDAVDWPSIGLKHHTSKLPSLSALAQISTFGFRGEALSALCALCESVTVTTATKGTAPMGAVIKLGRDGRVVDSSTRVARQRGTTINLSGLFTPLPVRRKEFERNAKREFAKALTTLTGYALVPSASDGSGDARGGVRLKVEAQAKNGKRNTVLATDGKGGLRSSVAAVWGAKALEGVVDMALEIDVEVDRAMARREGLTDLSQTVRVAGLVSSAAWGQGRSSADRQFFYINSRPCNLPKVAKTVNEVYKSFNTNQVPLAILDFQIPKESVDINVSPDKRTIFVHSEANLVEALRIALETFFQPTRSSYAVSGASRTVKLVQSDLTSFSQHPVEIEYVTPVEGTQGGDVGVKVGDEIERGEEGDGEVEVEVEEEEREEQGDEEGTLENREDEVEEGEGEADELDSEPEAGPSQPLRRTPRKTSQTIDTTQASWSPHRRVGNGRPVIELIRGSSRAGLVRASGSGSLSRSTSVLKAGTSGKQARKTLRKALAGYASQSGPVTEVDKDEEAEEEEEEEEGEGEVEEEELEEEGGRENEMELGVGDLGGVDDLDHDVLGGEVLSPLGDAEDNFDQDMDVDGDEDDDDMGNNDGKVDAADSDINGDTISDSPPSHPRERVRSAAEPLFADEADLTLADSDEESTPFGLFSDAAVPTSTLPVSTSTNLSSKSRLPSSAFRDEIISSAVQGEAVLRFDMARLRQRYARRQQINRASDVDPSRLTRDAFSAMADGQRTDAAGVGNKDFAAAEAALSRVIRKDDFERMEVVGQFNKGFIIARLRTDEEAGVKGKEMGVGTDDLFIVDQHASDEKFNFETLQRTTVIRAQSLIKPRPMQLTVGDEIVAMENLDVLRANGFDVVVDDMAPPGRGERISLAAMPVSKDTTFDFKDLEQLLHLLSDSARPAGQMVRCTKARSMFASRACRKSVMIGKSLTKAQMIQSMGWAEADQVVSCYEIWEQLTSLGIVHMVDQR